MMRFLVLLFIHIQGKRVSVMTFQQMNVDFEITPARTTKIILIFLNLFFIIGATFATENKNDPPSTGGDEHLKIYVYDSDLKTPMELARVVLRRGKAVVAQNVTNPRGLVEFIDIHEGWYNISVHFIDYNDFFDSILVDDQHSFDSIGLHAVNQQEVVILGNHELGTATFDLTTGNQVFESETYHATPTNQMTNLLQQSLMGAARAPTGEVHIRGQHGQFTYYVDGIPIPLGVFGGLNDVVDPKVIDRATFYTGGFPAEYGGQIAALVDIQNRVPTGKFHLDASSYIGSYLVTNAGDTLGEKVGSFKALNSNGQSLSFSGHEDRFGYFISGSRQESDRRIDQPIEQLFNDHGFDYFLYGKFDYQLSDIDYVTMNINFGRTFTQVPYDSVEQIADDVQNTTNQFQTFSYYRTLSDDKNKESNLFVGAYAREGELIYTPGAIDPPNFQFAGDTSHSYVLAEDRSFT